MNFQNVDFVKISFSIAPLGNLGEKFLEVHENHFYNVNFVEDYFLKL